MITVATAATPIPTSAGWVRRQRSETIAASPTTMATTRSQGGCSSHVVASVAAAIANEIRYIAASTTRSRGPRTSSGASMTAAGSAEWIQRVKRAVAIAREG